MGKVYSPSYVWLCKKEKKVGGNGMRKKRPKLKWVVRSNESYKLDKLSSTCRQNILMKNDSNWTKRLNFVMFGLLQAQCKEDNEDSTGQCSARDSRYSEVRQGQRCMYPYRNFWRDCLHDSNSQSSSPRMLTVSLYVAINVTYRSLV